jgi:Cof subfamily protein (haloacid dehalogenase superfamily)
MLYCFGGDLILKLIVSDLDGTLLNRNREISQENLAALHAAQEKGIEIAIASGRNYGNVLELCHRAGLNVHIISNNGSFVHDKTGKQLIAIGMDKQHMKTALEWLHNHHYFYNVSTEKEVFYPVNVEEILLSDFQTAASLNGIITIDMVKEKINRIVSQEGAKFMENFTEILDQDLTFGNISSITFNKEKLSKGKEYFKNVQDLAMTVSGDDIFEMIPPSASKGNALEILSNSLHIPLQKIMAIGDHYNDISMLEKVGYSVAMGNAEEDVKKICKYITLTNDLNGVGHIITQVLNGSLA